MSNQQDVTKKRDLSIISSGNDSSDDAIIEIDVEQALSTDNDQCSSSTMKKPSISIKRQRSNTYMSFQLKIHQQEDSLPDYLKSTNLDIKQLFQKVTIDLTSSMTLEQFRQFIVLGYQYTKLELEKKLWQSFLQSGIRPCNDNNNSNIGSSSWLLRLKSILLQSIKTNSNNEIIDTINNERCRSIVQTYLQQLEIQQHQYQCQLHEKTKDIYCYRTNIEPIIDRYLRQHLFPLKIDNDYQIGFINYHSQRQQIQLTIKQQSLSDNQRQFLARLFQQKYEQEKSKHEVIFLKLHVHETKFIEILRSVRIPIPSYMEMIDNTTIHEQLSEQHKKIIEYYRNQMMKAFIKIADEYRMVTQKLFDMTMSQFWHDQRTLPLYQRINVTVLDLIDQRLKNITEHVHTIYQYKTYRSLNNLSANLN